MIFQLGAPLLDACVLAVLAKGDAYGYILSRQVQEVIDISESTLYPVLRRLQKEECLTTYDRAFSGRNRRYYHLTDKGRESYLRYVSEWQSYKKAIDFLLGGSSNE